MNNFSLVILSCLVLTVSAWSVPYYHSRQRAPLRFTRFAPPPPPHFRLPSVPDVPRHYKLPRASPTVPVEHDTKEQQRPKRGHHDFDDHDRSPSGVTGPVHTFVKTDKNANYKWGVRHHVGDKFSS